MSETIKALVFGIVQGLTEFLPVSSSGHLEIAKFILADSNIGKESLLMTVVLHFATALSTVVVFRQSILEIFKGLLKFKNSEEFWFCLNIVVSMVPAALVGVLFENEIESLFKQNMLLIGCMLLLTGGLLMLADRAKDTDKPVGIVEAILVGISQAIAILPGISRSGATISTSVLLGIDRERAARFSFLMVIPLIFGKMGKLFYDAWKDGQPFAQPGEAMPLTIGFITAFITGCVACLWMIQLVKSSKLSYFSIYCLVVGVLAIAVSLSRWAPAFVTPE